MGATAVRGCAAIPRASMSHIAKKARQNGGGRAAIARPHSTANEDAVVAEDGKGSKKVMTSDDKPESVPFKRYHGAKLMMGDSVFAELELAEAAQKVGGVRVRQHVNPLKASLQSQAPVPAWTDVYASTARPLVVDIGCGGGRFDLMMAKKYPETNFLGVDIRAPLVERGNKWGEYAGVVDNLHFAECNATVSMGKWLKSYADDCGSKVETVAIQFPDPHFKKRHHKRRVVQPALVRALAEGLTPGARVFLQSDVKDVSEDMRDKFERFGAHLFDIDASLHDVSAVDPAVLKSNAESAVANAAAAFQEDEKARLRREKAEKEGYPGRRKDAEKAEGEEKAEEKAKEAPEAEEEGEGWRSAWAAAGDREGWLDENPLGVPTEREVQTNSTNGRCYRVMLVRNSTPV